jgi:hypothetical protein
MIEKDFNPQTMTRATPADISRIWARLWGKNTTVLYILGRFETESGEYLDLTQRMKMPKGYNSINDIKTNSYEIGICPICSIRLTHGCEHSQTQLAQEWLAAVIVAEQELVPFVWEQPTDAHAMPHGYKDYTAEVDASEADAEDQRRTQYEAAM